MFGGLKDKSLPCVSSWDKGEVLSWTRIRASGTQVMSLPYRLCNQLVEPLIGGSFNQSLLQTIKKLIGKKQT